MEVDFDDFNDEELGDERSGMQSIHYINEDSVNEAGDASRMSVPTGS